MRLLNRIDTSKLKILVIQYNDNDYHENKAFYNNTLRIASRKAYERVAKEYLRSRRYYPGKYVIFGLRNYLLGGRSRSVDISNTQAAFFLNTLKNAGRKNLSNVRIIVVEFNGNKKFVSSLREQIASGSNTGWCKNISIVGLPGEILHSGRFQFSFDEHVSACGHKVIADEVLKVIIKR